MIAEKTIFVSSCLLGKKCLYHGFLCTFARPKLEELQSLGFLIVDACPEMLGGLPCPRPPSYVRDGRVLQRKKDITHLFELGATKAAEILKEADPIVVLLLKNSPSCDPVFGIFGQQVALKYPTIACQRKNDWLARLNDILDLPPSHGSLFQ